MKKYPFYLLFFLFSVSATAQEYNQYGVRLMTPIIFSTVKFDTSEIFESARARLGVQLGVYRHWPLSKWLSLKGELNYSLMGYTAGLKANLDGIRKINYHYFGVTLLPALHAGRVVSFQAGAAANYLVNSPPVSPVFTSSSPRFDLAIVAGIALRYDLLEIQVRYHHSLRPFTPAAPTEAFFRSMGLGLAYYFN